MGYKYSSTCYNEPIISVVRFEGILLSLPSDPDPCVWFQGCWALEDTGHLPVWEMGTGLSCAGVQGKTTDTHHSRQSGVS